MSIIFQLRDTLNNIYGTRLVDNFTDPINYGSICGLLYSLGINELLLVTLQIEIANLTLLSINEKQKIEVGNDIKYIEKTQPSKIEYVNKNIKDIDNDIILYKNNIIVINIISESKDIIEMIKISIEEKEQVEKVEFIDSETFLSESREGMPPLINSEENDDKLVNKIHQEIDKIEMASKYSFNNEEQEVLDELILNEPLTNTKDDEEVDLISKEVIQGINEKSIELFADEDFRNLIKIYKTKPELFSIFNQYIQQTGVDESILCVSDINEDKEYYESLVKEIESLNLGVSKKVIYNRLIKFKGHLNLVVRSLLF